MADAAIAVSAEPVTGGGAPAAADLREEAPAILEIAGLTKNFGNFTALKGIDLTVREGEFLTIVGPSGSGKTTLIRLLVGMEAPTEGTIHLRGKRIDGTPANERPTCMVFQSLALFPHRSVGENIEFPLKIRGVSKAARRARANELLSLLHLPAHYYSKRIQECSGGERQRVALARALAFDPEILFFDEPLSALDYRLRKALEKELKALHAETGKTFVYITHSLEEAMVMSDRIAIMRAGQFEQMGTPDAIYDRPVSRFVAEFMGDVNLFDIRRENGTLSGDGLTIRRSDLDAPQKGVLVARPEALRVLGPGEHADFELTGTIAADYNLGGRIQYEIDAAGGRKVTMESLSADRSTLRHGADVRVGWSADHCHLIAED